MTSDLDPRSPMSPAEKRDRHFGSNKPALRWRAHRRGLALSAGGLIAMGIAASIVYPYHGHTPNPGANPTALTSVPASSPNAHNDRRPGCGPLVEARRTDGGPTGKDEVISTISLGMTATVEVEVTGAPSILVLRGSIVVAAPGSTSGAGNPAYLPSTAAARPENQIMEGIPIVGRVIDTARSTVTFRPVATGTYPVYFMAQTIQSENCQAPAPSLADVGTPPPPSVQELGSIVVE
jgi:hypothetical protein